MFARVLPPAATHIGQATRALRAPTTVRTMHLAAASASSNSRQQKQQQSATGSPQWRWLLAAGGATLLAGSAAFYQQQRETQRQISQTADYKGAATTSHLGGVRSKLGDVLQSLVGVGASYPRHLRVAHAASSDLDVKVNGDGHADAKANPELDWRERIRGNYNNRIRTLSTPEKVFSTFASVHINGKVVVEPRDNTRHTCSHTRHTCSHTRHHQSSTSAHGYTVSSSHVYIDTQRYRDNTHTADTQTHQHTPHQHTPHRHTHTHTHTYHPDTHKLTSLPLTFRLTLLGWC
jgi:hypothetical protein